MPLEPPSLTLLVACLLAPLRLLTTWLILPCLRGAAFWGVHRRETRAYSAFYALRRRLIPEYNAVRKHPRGIGIAFNSKSSTIKADAHRLVELVRRYHAGQCKLVCLYDAEGILLKSFGGDDAKSGVIEEATALLPELVYSSAYANGGRLSIPDVVFEGIETTNHQADDVSTSPAETIVAETTSIACLKRAMRIPAQQMDVLLLCGVDRIGDFPPLALKNCEIYRLRAPLREFDYLSAIIDQYGKSEQRYGT